MSGPRRRRTLQPLDNPFGPIPVIIDEYVVVGSLERTYDWSFDHKQREPQATFLRAEPTTGLPLCSVTYFTRMEPIWRR